MSNKNKFGSHRGSANISLYKECYFSRIIFVYIGLYQNKDNFNTCISIVTVGNGSHLSQVPVPGQYTGNAECVHAFFSRVT